MGKVCTWVWAADSNRLGLNGKTRSPAVEVPSGNMQIGSFGKRVSSWLAISLPCLLLSLRMNTVPICSAIQPNTGQSATSDFATKRHGKNDWILAISIQEMWLAAIRYPPLLGNSSALMTRCLKWKIVSRCIDQCRMCLFLVWSLAKGKIQIRIDMPLIVWAMIFRNGMNKNVDLARILVMIKGWTSSLSRNWHQSVTMFS